jgi:hypothetical protein
LWRARRGGWRRRRGKEGPRRELLLPGSSRSKVTDRGKKVGEYRRKFPVGILFIIRFVVQKKLGGNITVFETSRNQSFS